MAKNQPVESVFLNVPYDSEFEDLYLAYIVGLTQLGLAINATLAVPNQDRLATIIELIEQSHSSIHDLSRIELSDGIPRFNMPLELGLAIYRSHITRGAHRVHVFESEAYRAQRSTSDINRIDTRIHHGRAKDLMISLRNIFRQQGDTTTVPEMLASYEALKNKVPALRKAAGDGSLFETAAFRDLTVAASVEAQRRIKSRRLP